MANEKAEFRTKEKSVSEELSDIHEALDKLSDRLTVCFKKTKTIPDLITKSVPQMINQLQRAFSDLELALCDVTRRTKETEDAILAEKKAK